MSQFSSDFNGFFKDLAKNNNKEWFDLHRKRYITSVKEPFADFISDVIGRIGKLDKAVGIEAKDAIFRINRDIRFSKDKTPYKLSCSAIISPQGRKDHSTPGLYLELGPESVKIFGGAYLPDKEQLKGIRTAIMNDRKGWRKVIDAKPFKAHFGRVQGDTNKVIPGEFKNAAQAEPYIANKQFYVMAELPASSVEDPKLMERVMQHYKVLRPFNDWLAKAMS